MHVFKLIFNSVMPITLNTYNIFLQISSLQEDGLMELYLPVAKGR